MVFMKLAGGFSMCGNLVSRNDGHELHERNKRSRSSPCCVARLYASSALSALSLRMLKKTSMSRMIPSFTRRYSLNESFSNRDTPAMTASLVVKLLLTASQSKSRRIAFWMRGSFSMSSASVHVRISVASAALEPAASRSSRGILSKLTTTSSRYTAYERVHCDSSFASMLESSLQLRTENMHLMRESVARSSSTHFCMRRSWSLNSSPELCRSLCSRTCVLSIVVHRVASTIWRFRYFTRNVTSAMDAPDFTVSRSVWTCFSFGPHTSLFVAFSTATQMCCEGSNERWKVVEGNRDIRVGRRQSRSGSSARWA